MGEETGAASRQVGPPSGLLSGLLDAAVVVAVVAVGAVQVAVHQVVGVVAVRDRLVAAAGAVAVGRVVGAAGVGGGAGRRVGRVDGQHVLLDPGAGGVVQVAVVQVIDVAVVADGGVPAAGPVLVLVAFVMGRHVSRLLPGTSTPGPRPVRWRGPGR